MYYFMPNGQRVVRSVRLKFKASNNEVEYEVAINALRGAKELEVTRVQLFTNSKLLASLVVSIKLKPMGWVLIWMLSGLWLNSLIK